MKKNSFKLILLILCSFTVLYLYSKVSSNKIKKSDVNRPLPATVFNNNDTTYEVERVVLSFVVCESRYRESLNLVKSLLLFTRVRVLLIIFADENMRSRFNVTLTKWRHLTNNQFDFELHEVRFPKEQETLWMNLFKTCAAQRLFIPSLLQHIDALIYVDIDTLFLGPVEELWHFFTQFNSSQISAMAFEHNTLSDSWYSRSAKHPFYGKYGLNSGVMLMNLTRMRSFGWVDYLTPIMQKWKHNIPWGDQDIINIIFHYHDRAVYVLSCRFNFRSDQCEQGGCADATARGVYLLHGNRAAFLAKFRVYPIFQAIYRVIDEHVFGTDPSKYLIKKMNQYVYKALPSNCGRMNDAFLKVPTRTFSNLYPVPDRQHTLHPVT